MYPPISLKVAFGFFHWNTEYNPMLSLSDHQTMVFNDQCMIPKATFIEIDILTTSRFSAGNLTEGVFKTRNHEMGKWLSDFLLLLPYLKRQNYAQHAKPLKYFCALCAVVVTLFRPKNRKFRTTTSIISYLQCMCRTVSTLFWLWTFYLIVILTYVKVVALLFLICSASLDVSADWDTAVNFPTKELFLAHVMSLCEPITKALRDNNLVTRAFRSYACAIIEKSSGVKNARDYSTTTE